MNLSLLPLLVIFVFLFILYCLSATLKKETQFSLSRLKFIPLTLVLFFLGSSAFAEENASDTDTSNLQQLEIPSFSFEENPIYDFGLSVTYQISGSVYKMLNRFNLSPDHLTGYSFEPTHVNTFVDAKTHKVIYTLEGNLNWNFLGLTFLSVKREYQGS